MAGLMRTKDGWRQYLADWDALPEDQRDTDPAWRIVDEAFDRVGLSHGTISMRWATADAEPGVLGVVWALRTCANVPALGPAWAATARRTADRIVAHYGLSEPE